MRAVVRLTTTEKIGHFLYALKQHAGIISIALLFVIIGAGACCIPWLYFHEPDWGLICIGLPFVLIPLFGLGYTLPSSIQYYYEKSLAKKYGVNIEATVTNKHIDDYSYTETMGMNDSLSGQRYRRIEEYHYFIEYKYEVGESYTGEFDVAGLGCYKKIEVGDFVPIQVLAFKPDVSFPRRRRLAEILGVRGGECN